MSTAKVMFLTASAAYSLRSYRGLKTKARFPSPVATVRIKRANAPLKYLTSLVSLFLDEKNNVGRVHKESSDRGIYTFTRRITSSIAPSG